MNNLDISGILVLVIVIVAAVGAAAVTRLVRKQRRLDRHSD